LAVGQLHTNSDRVK